MTSSEPTMEQASQIVMFERLSGVAVRKGVPANRLTTMGAGCPLPWLVEPSDRDQLVKISKAAQSLSLALLPLGAGSNVVLPDSPLQSLIIRLGKSFRTFEMLGDERLLVGAAMPLMTLSRSVSEEGLSGLEFAGGIPATLGGAIAMNAGAHGGEMADCVERVDGILPSGEFVSLSAQELEFGYRTSTLPNGFLVLACELRLARSQAEKTAALRAEFLGERKLRQPLSEPSSGSVFRNPSGELSAGALLEKAGLKGKRQGGASISELHANWIVNKGREASQQDIRRLIEHAQQQVREMFAVELIPEIRLW